MRNILSGLLVVLLVFSFSLTVEARKKKKEAVDTTKAKKENLSEFDKFFKNREKTGYRVSGMIEQFVQGKNVFYVFPLELLGENMLLASTIAEVSDNGEVLVGEKPFNPMLVNFTISGNNIQIREDRSYAFSDDANIQRAIKMGNMPSILMELPIITYNNDSTAVLFNARELALGENIPALSVISPYALNSFYGNIIRNGRVIRDRCYFTGARGYADNISTIVSISCDVTAHFWGMFEVYRDKPFTAVVNRTLMRLPKEPMRPRLADPRIGVFPTGKYNYTLSENGVTVTWFANRWRIEPSDEEAYKQGELVVPKKPIVFYIDNMFPKEWIKYIQLGVNDWNIAFEKIGYKNAVQYKMFPTQEEDPDFDPNNLKYSCIRYAPTVEENSMGPSWVDPRTGEILNASVYIYHDIISLLNKWRFVQTAAADKRVRMEKLPDELLGDALRYVVAHEVGHCLGLMHNMGASAAIPTDSLRSPSFTRKYGTTPSIMDYARFNYVAQPGDLEKGVQLTPPRIGVYDEYVIHWMYAPIFEAKIPEEEVEILNKWIQERSEDPMYRYGKQQIYAYDPSSQTECLGDDGVKASQYGIKNLRYICEHAAEWIKGNPNPEYKLEIMTTIENQYAMYLLHVLNEMGGIYLTEHKESDAFKKIQPVSKEKQKKALAFLMNELKNMEWLTNIVFEELPLSSDYSRSMATFIYGTLWNIRKRNVGLAAEYAKGKEVYSLEEYVNDITRAIYEPTRFKKNLNEQERFLQCMHLESLLTAGGYELPGNKDAFSSFKENQIMDILRKDFKMYSMHGIHTNDYYDLQKQAYLLAQQKEIALPQEISSFFFQGWINFREGNTEYIYVTQIENIKTWIKQALMTCSAQTKNHYLYLLGLINKLIVKK